MLLKVVSEVIIIIITTVIIIIIIIRFMAVETIANKLQGYIKNAFRFSVLYFFSIITLI